MCENGFYTLDLVYEGWSTLLVDVWTQSGEPPEIHKYVHLQHRQVMIYVSPDAAGGEWATSSGTNNMVTGTGIDYLEGVESIFRIKRSIK